MERISDFHMMTIMFMSVVLVYLATYLALSLSYFLFGSYCLSFWTCYQGGFQCICIFAPLELHILLYISTIISCSYIFIIYHISSCLSSSYFEWTTCLYLGSSSSVLLLCSCGALNRQQMHRIGVLVFIKRFYKSK
jgi:hypothetical protein